MKSPILMYHALSGEKLKNAYTIMVEDFAGHLEFLKSGGYKPILVDEYHRALTDPLAGLPERCVLITFDDGHESDFTLALPALKKFGFSASFFVTTDWIGAPGYMSAEQLRGLKKAGMSVQSHAKTHRFLDRLSPEEQLAELEASKKVLEGILGSGVSFMSFPGGRYDRGVVRRAGKAGYTACFSSLPFSLSRVGAMPVIGRYAVRYTSGKVALEGLFGLSFAGRAFVKCSYLTKDLLKKVLGDDTYYFLWKKYISR